MPKENLIDRVLEMLIRGRNGLNRDEIVLSENELKQTIQTELKKIAEDVIGEEMPVPYIMLSDGSLFATGYNNKRQELITYFQNIGVIK